MSRILLTGTTGLIGSRLVATLGPHHELYGVCRRPLAITAPVTPVMIDLAADWSVESLPNQLDAVIYLAQSNRWQQFPAEAEDIFAVNVASVVRLLNYALRAGASQFIFASTGGLYGSCEHAVTEDTPLRIADGPLHFYFETKRAAETLALAYRGRMRISILRPFFVYGDGQRTPKLVQGLIDSVRSGSAVRIRGESGTVLNPVAVDDVIKVVEACLRDGYHGIVNVAGSQVTSIRSMVSRIGELLDVKPNFHIEPGVPDQFVADIAVMRTLIKGDPVGFDEGIAALLCGVKQS